MLVRLPWPPKELNPNARLHHMAKARVVKSYRETCYWLAVAALWRGEALTKPLIKLTFCPPDKRRRDLDNMLASFKAGADAVADALRVNDHLFDLLLTRGEPVKDGAVIVEIGNE